MESSVVFNRVNRRKKSPRGLQGQHFNLVLQHVTGQKRHLTHRTIIKIYSRLMHRFASKTDISPLKQFVKMAPFVVKSQSYGRFHLKIRQCEPTKHHPGHHRGDKFGLLRHAKYDFADMVAAFNTGMGLGDVRKIEFPIDHRGNLPAFQQRPDPR